MSKKIHAVRTIHAVKVTVVVCNCYECPLNREAALGVRAYCKEMIERIGRYSNHYLTPDKGIPDWCPVETENQLFTED